MNYRFGFAIASLASGLLIGGPAAAQTATQESTETFSESIEVQQTDYLEAITLPKFNTELGTLDRVLLTFGGSVSGRAGADNTGPSAIDAATLNLAADLTLSEPVLGNIFTIQPVGSETFALAPDEGDFPSDFAGADGVSFSDISGTATDDITYDEASALAVFAGATDPVFEVNAIANSSATGSGNIDQLFRTNAGADLAVTYFYTPVPVTPPNNGGGNNPQAVPEASTTMGLLAIAALGYFSRSASTRPANKARKQSV